MSTIFRLNVFFSWNNGQVLYIDKIQSKIVTWAHLMFPTSHCTQSSVAKTQIF